MTLPTGSPQALPDLPTLRRLTKSLAMLDAILSPEWQYRYYSFNSQWSAGAQMASMRDGCGDDWFLLFAPWGAALKGFAHESALAKHPSFPDRVQQSLPSSFASFLNEKAFSMDRATFCWWRGHSDSRWSVVSLDDTHPSSDLDGSAELLGILDGNPQTYQMWAQSYYERDVSLLAVQAIYEHRPLDEALLAALNPELTPVELRPDIDEIGYPEPQTPDQSLQRTPDR